MGLFKQLYDFVYNIFNNTTLVTDRNTGLVETLIFIFFFSMAIGIVSLFIKMVANVKSAGLYE